MERTYAGMLAKEILEYKYKKHKVVVNKIGTEEVTIDYDDDKKATLFIFPDNSRKLLYAEGALEVYPDKIRCDTIIAVETTNLATFWYINGKLGRENGLPAIEWATGGKDWYIDGKLGRADGLPAVLHPDGSLEWYIDGKLNRANGLPAIERRRH